MSYSRLGKEKTKEVNTQVIVLNWNLVELWNSPADASVDEEWYEGTQLPYVWVRQKYLL